MALTALNSLFYGGNKQMSSSVVDCVQGLPLCQQDVIRSVIKRIQLLGRPPDSACRSGALSALRATAGSYCEAEPGVGDVVPMKLAALSLPTGNVAGVDLLEHLTGHDKLVVSEFERYMLQDSSVWTDLQDRAHELKPYDDPSLRSHARYLQFLKHLFSCGVLGFTENCKGRVGAFTVSKKPKVINGASVERQRLVLDCRQTNLQFKVPPLTQLGSLSALGELELQGGQKLFAAGADIRDCFYACYCPPGMEDYFCLMTDLRPDDASMVSGLNVECFSQMRRICPCIKVLPMGFNWSFYLVQTLHESISLRSLGLRKEDMVIDGSPAPMLSNSGVTIMPYCDNVHCLGLKAGVTQQAKDSVCEGLQQSGFELHEDVGACNYFPTLGGIIDGELGHVRPTSKRVWNLILAFEHLCTASISYKLVQQLLGHAMVVCVLNRSGMSVFRALYDFVQKGGPPRKLNNSEVWECRVFIGILPLLFCDMRREWADVATCTDASPSGYGICEQRVSTQQARSLGRWQERWRFRRLPPSEWKPRERWEGRDPFSDPLTVTGGLAESDDLDNYVSNGDFPEVPSSFMSPSCWSTVKMGRWGNTSEHITLKEGRALVIATRRLSRTKRHRGKRHVVIVDNLALAFSVCKGRSNNFAMLRVLQQLGALCLAAELTLRPRWVPSEWNVSDGPSRGQVSPGAFCYEGSCTTTRSKELQKSKSRSKAISETECESNGIFKVDIESHSHEKPKVCGVQFNDEEGPTTTEEKGYKDSSSPRREHWEEGPHEAVDCFGVKECERRSAEPISTVLRQVQGLLPGERHPLAAFNRGSRRVDGRLLGLSLHTGQNGWRRRKIFSISRVPRPEVQGQDASQQKSSARVAGGSSTSKPSSPSQTCHVRDSHADAFQEQTEHGAHDDCQFRSLSSSGGGPRPETASHCSPGDCRWLPIPMGNSDHSGSRRGSSGQDWCVRQCVGNQQQGDVMDGQRVAIPCKEAESQGRHVVQLQHGQLPRGVCSMWEDAQSRRSPPLSTSSRWSDSRPNLRSKGSQWCEGTGTLEDRSKRSQICQNRSCPTTPQSDECSSNLILPLVRTEYRKGVCRPDSTKTAPLTPWDDLFSCKSRPRRFALEIFAGTARVAAALHEQKIDVFPIDTCLFPSHNVLDPHISDYISNLIRQHRITLIWLGMPCTTFSRARRNDGLGPGPLRDSNYLWGLPNLRPSERKKLFDGNNLFGFTMHILELCNRYHIPFVLENPLTSMAWEMQPLQRFKSQSGAMFCDLDFCQFGEIWKKPTRLMYKGIDISSLGLKCTGTIHRCSRTHRQHLPLKGRDASGQFWTLRAQPYPLAMCKEFASVAARALRGWGVWVGSFNFQCARDGHMFFP